jgi:hypothetical protein
MNLFLTPAEDQRPFDAAVVIVTVIRPSLEQAIESVFAQDVPGRVQILVGVDKPLGDWKLLERLHGRAPANRVLSVLYPGYSTSVRHGGLYPAVDGGCLRTVLSLLANARHVAYLDDDNWWAPDHLSSLLRAVEGQAFAYSQRWLVDDVTRQAVCVDRWHSTGCVPSVLPGMDQGFCDPSTLLIDKTACPLILPYWSLGPADMSDRVFFKALREGFPGRGTERATSYYRVRRTNVLWRYITADASVD